jgi:hypothetical protein
VRAFVFLVPALVACNRAPEPKQIDLGLIHVSTGARLRTDNVGVGDAAPRATFVLVDAGNTSHDDAYVTLGGTLKDDAGAVVGALKGQTLLVPAGGERTFALVDDQRAARPTATTVSIEVRRAQVPTSPPLAHVDEVRAYPDFGKLVANGVLINDSDRQGNIMVVASFHDAEHKPMTRPFSMIVIGAHVRQTVQFVSPPGATTAAIYVADVLY